MINNKVILELNSKEVTPKTIKNLNVEKAAKERSFIESDFKKILNENSQRYDDKKNKNLDNQKNNILNNKIEKSLDNKVKNSLNDKGNINNNPTEIVDKPTVEEVIEKAVEFINNEENFQGNKIEDTVIEEVLLLLNQILNSPQFENLLSVKLEDPMYVTSGNIETMDILNKQFNNEDEVSLLNNMNIESDVEIQSNSANTEALRLVNTILETLDFENINEVIPTDKVNTLKENLQVLSGNLFNNISDLTESTSEEGFGINNLIENLKDVKSNGKNSRTGINTDTDINNTDSNSSAGEVADLSSEKIKGILTDLKSNLSSDKSTSNYMEGIGVTPEEPTEEDKVLAKILSGDESGALNKQGSFINRLNVKSEEVIKEPMVVSKETMDADIIKNVKFMIKNAVSELKVKIYPKELGEMTIKLLSEEGILKADIRATSKETYNLLHSNMSEIKKSLEQQNIKIYEVNIGLYSEDTTYYSGEQAKDETFKNNENRQGRNSSRESVFLTDDLENDENLYDDSSINILA